MNTKACVRLARMDTNTRCMTPFHRRASTKLGMLTGKYISSRHTGCTGYETYFLATTAPPPGMRHEREIAKERRRAPKMRCARLLWLLRRRHGCREGCLWPTAQPHGPGRLCRCPHKRRFSAVHARATPRERASRGMRARMSKMHGSMHGMREIRLHRTRTRKQRASVYTPGQRNDPTNENSTAASKCLREATHQVEKNDYACMRAT